MPDSEFKVKRLMRPVLHYRSQAAVQNSDPIGLQGDLQWLISTSTSKFQEIKLCVGVLLPFWLLSNSLSLSHSHNMSSTSPLQPQPNMGQISLPPGMTTEQFMRLQGQLGGLLQSKFKRCMNACLMIFSHVRYYNCCRVCRGRLGLVCAWLLNLNSLNDNI